MNYDILMDDKLNVIFESKKSDPMLKQGLFILGEAKLIDTNSVFKEENIESGISKKSIVCTSNGMIKEVLEFSISVPCLSS